MLTKPSPNIQITGTAASIQAKEWAQKRKEQIERAREERGDYDDEVEEEEEVPKWMAKRAERRRVFVESQRKRALGNMKRMKQEAGKFGIKIVNRRGKSISFNKFASKSYTDLRETQINENKYRKKVSVSKDRNPINNLDNRFTPKIDPRVLRNALKQQEAYKGE